MSASDAPRRQAGLRTRSGNAMLRTRVALLDAAAVCVEKSGVRRTTMSDIAATGGVAKATLYNHFRTKDDVLAALVESRVAALAAGCAMPGGAAGGLAGALGTAAAGLASDGALRRVRDDEPALLLPLTAPGEGRGWEQARAAVADLLRGADVPAGPHEVDLVLRWLVSQLLWPLPADAAPAAAELLVRAVTPAAGASVVPEQGRPTGNAQSVGLGWPGRPDRLRTR